MEKITKEEIMEKLGGKALGDEELEQVSGGWNNPNDCYNYCHHLYTGGTSLENCLSKCYS